MQMNLITGRCGIKNWGVGGTASVFGLVTKIGEPRQTSPKRGTKATIKDNRTPV